MTTRTPILKRPGWTTITAPTLINVHRRRIGSPEAARQLLGQVHLPESGVWPTDGWPPLILDRGLEPGSTGGHGPIRYAVARVDPGRVRFVFSPASGIDGFHEFRVEQDGAEGDGDRAEGDGDRAEGDGDRAELVHELRIDGPTRLLRATIIPLHDALIEDLFDNVDALLVGAPPPKRRWSLRVRILRRFLEATQTRKRRATGSTASR